MPLNATLASPSIMEHDYIFHAGPLNMTLFNLIKILDAWPFISVHAGPLNMTIFNLIKILDAWPYAIE